MYNLYTITNPEILDEVLSNTCGFATSVLIVAATLSLAALTAPFSTTAWKCAYIATSCSYCCLIMVCKLCWLMLYGSGVDVGIEDGRDGEGSKSVSSDD